MGSVLTLLSLGTVPGSGPPTDRLISMLRALIVTTVEFAENVVLPSAVDAAFDVFCIRAGRKAAARWAAAQLIVGLSLAVPIPGITPSYAPPTITLEVRE